MTADLGRAPAGSRRDLAYAALLALALALGAFWLEGRIDWNPADEGFQWYGAVATAHGAVPLRDFRSYDPGRYLWNAAWAKLLGDGIVALRLSTALFAAGGLFCGLRAARRAVGGRRWALALVGLLLVLWMSPRHKLFEAAVAMALVLVAVRLIEKPSPGRYFAAGVAVGLAAFLGKNHGLYGLIALSLLALYLGLREPGGLGRRLLAGAAGIAAGSAPFLVMLAIPGFARAFLDSCLFFVVQGRTNNPVPVPWPWASGAYAGLAGWSLVYRIAIGAAFVLLPLAGAAALATGLAGGREPAPSRRLLLAAGAVGCVYLHHAFARADVSHLAQASHPILLGMMALPLAAPPGRRRLAVGAMTALLLALTLGVAVPQRELFNRLTAGGDPAERFVRYRLGGDEIWLRRRAARLYFTLARRLDRWVPAGEPVLIVPLWPGLYPALGRPSPVWDTYPTWPGRGGLDERMLAEIQGHRVRWAVLALYPVPPTEGQPFPTNYPRVFRYLMAGFEHLPDPRLPGNVWLLRKRGSGR